MTIAIKVPRAVRIRWLYDTGLNAEDIARVKGWSFVAVQEALAIRRPIKK